MFRLLFFKGLGLITAALFLAAANSFGQKAKSDTTICNDVYEHISDNVYIKKTICVTFEKPKKDTVVIIDTVIIHNGSLTNGVVKGGALRYETPPQDETDNVIPSIGMVKKLIPPVPDPPPFNNPKPDITQVFFSAEYTKPVIEIDYNSIGVGEVFSAEITGYYYNATGSGKDMLVKLQSGTKDISQPASFGSFPNNSRMHPVKFTLNIIRTNQTDVYAWCTVWSGNQLFTANSYATASQMSQFGTINATANAGSIKLTVGGFNSDATKNYFRRDAILYK